MRHVHYDPEAGGRTPGYSVRAAYVRLVAGLLGAVVLTTAAWAGWYHGQLRALLLRSGMYVHDLQEQLSALWGVDLTGNIALDSLSFAVTRLTSPFVLGTLLGAGAVTLFLTTDRSPTSWLRNVTPSIESEAVAAAYARLVASLAGAVVLTTALWWAVFDEQFRFVGFLHDTMPPRDFETYVSTLWNVELTGIAPIDGFLFAFTYFISPFVLGTVVAAAIVALVLSK